MGNCIKVNKMAASRYSACVIGAFLLQHADPPFPFVPTCELLTRSARPKPSEDIKGRP